MTKIILISGKKRSGKDWVAEMLSKHLETQGKSVEVKAFAKPMKEIISIIFGITEEELDEYKNNPDEYKIIVEKNGCSVKHVTNFRNILKLFGNEAMKPIFGESVWVDLLKFHVKNSSADYFIVPDFRFPIEYINNAVTVRSECNLTDKEDKHDSEIALDDYVFHYVLNNDDYGLTSKHISEFAKRIIQENK